MAKAVFEVSTHSYMTRASVRAAAGSHRAAAFRVCAEMAENHGAADWAMYEDDGQVVVEHVTDGQGPKVEKALKAAILGCGFSVARAVSR